MLVRKSITLFMCLICFLVFSLSFSLQEVFAIEEKSEVKSYVLMEYNSGQILKESEKDKQLPVASVTKLMTILLVLEKIDNNELDPQKIVVCSETASKMGGSQVFLETGGEYKIEDLLKASIIASANDACVLLAEEVAGSEQEFCRLMNEKAKQLNLKNTNYVNSTGLPAPMQYSSAYDVAIVFREVLKYPKYFELSKIWMEDFVHPQGRITTMSNTNKLLKTFNGCDGGKTGSTGEAGYCLASTAKRGDMRLISIVLGAENSKQRFSASSNLLNEGFNNYDLKKLVDKNINFAEDITIQKTTENDLQIFAEEDFYVVTKKGEQTSYTTKIELPEVLSAPLKEGDVVGKIYVLDNGVVQKEINIIVNNDIEQLSWFEISKMIAKKWSI